MPVPTDGMEIIGTYIRKNTFQVNLENSKIKILAKWTENYYYDISFEIENTGKKNYTN